MSILNWLRILKENPVKLNIPPVAIKHRAAMVHTKKIINNFDFQNDNLIFSIFLILYFTINSPNSLRGVTGNTLKIKNTMKNMH
jgi:hypothetical protein